MLPIRFCFEIEKGGLGRETLLVFVIVGWIVSTEKKGREIYITQ